MPHARIMPLHFEGWAHFTEGRDVIERVFAEAGLADRLIWGEASSRMARRCSTQREEVSINNRYLRQSG